MKTSILKQRLNYNTALTMNYFEFCQLVKTEDYKLFRTNVLTNQVELVFINSKCEEIHFFFYND